ncbi:MAG: hypothetical protein EOO54_19220, partial [Haliea sp.]
MKFLAQKNVLILGLGASGLAMARWCVRHGARVTVADTRDAPRPRMRTFFCARNFIGVSASRARPGTAAW